MKYIEVELELALNNPQYKGIRYLKKTQPETDLWLPRSQIKKIIGDSHEGAKHRVWIPKWLAEAKHLKGREVTEQELKDHGPRLS